MEVQEETTYSTGCVGWERKRTVHGLQGHRVIFKGILVYSTKLWRCGRTYEGAGRNFLVNEFQYFGLIQPCIKPKSQFNPF